MIDLTGHTNDAILAEMLLRVSEQVNKRTGSLIRTALSAASWPIEGIYIDLMYVQKQAYGMTATGEYLDYKAEERGLTRLPATNAVYELRCNINGLPLNFQFGDSNNYTWNVTTGVLSGPDADGLYLYHITCQTGGSIPESSGALQALSFYAGLTTALFGDIVTPGKDIETDSELRKRYQESMVEIAFAGNVDAYREKILSTTFNLSGGTNALVGALQVFPTTDINGQYKGGNVKIYILNTDMEKASQPLIDAVQNEICPMYNGVATGDGFGWAPIGAAVHVVSATSTPILHVKMWGVLSGTKTRAEVEEKIYENLMKYVRTLKANWGIQVTNRNASANLIVRDAFLYAAGLVEGVTDITEVEILKEGVIHPGAASWVTNATSMEWIQDSQVVFSFFEI